MTYERLGWDSDFFGIPIGRVPAGDPEGLRRSVAAADRDGIRCLYLLCPADDDTTLGAALDIGFRPYDVRIELARGLDGTRARPAREADGADAPALERIAAERFDDTRFFADPHFPRARCRQLYVEWLRRGLSTAPVRRTFTAGDAEGFVTCRFDPTAGVGTIELIAVASAATGRGLGGALVQAADGAFAAAGLSRAEVVTQARNVAAQRMYQRQGYLTRRAGVWLHRWREPGP